MSAPSYKAIADAALAAIHTLIIDGKAEAAFQGRSYRAIDLPQLEQIHHKYRQLAIANGEMPLVPGVDKVSVSTPLITDLYQWV